MAALSRRQLVQACLTLTVPDIVLMPWHRTDEFFADSEDSMQFLQCDFVILREDALLFPQAVMLHRCSGQHEMPSSSV